MRYGLCEKVDIYGGGLLTDKTQVRMGKACTLPVGEPVAMVAVVTTMARHKDAIYICKVDPRGTD